MNVGGREDLIYRGVDSATTRSVLYDLIVWLVTPEPSS